MSVWKQVASSIGGIFSQTASQMAREPLEMGQSAVSQISGDTGTSEAGQQQATPVSQPTNDSNGEFRNQQDAAKYEQLAKRKDEIELAQIRANLQDEFGLETDLKKGMQRASMEYVQKEQERNKVEEKKKQEEEWMVEKKKKEDVAITAAKAQGGAENKAWGAG
ncbi:MAG: hypothetical protein WCL07_03745 [bacterium]